ncbi:FecCD family ABC transporter permease [Cohnella yongneupensis]|uniref:FecCD family ABC transporter permease n=1 Tax=Cohnella yongneupensis TaxID=425006 RepID=A0ABW0R3E3_9BACL
MLNLSSDAHKRERRRNLLILSVLGALILLVFIVSMNTGTTRLTPLEVLRTLFGGGNSEQKLILFDFRLPRIVLSVLVGAGLGVAGCVLQAISRNALAEPGIIGINAGAGLFVLVFTAFYTTPGAAPVYLLPLLAWIGAGLTAGLVFFLSFRPGRGLSSTRLLLNGIAITSGITAVTIVLTQRINAEQYQFYATWMAGSIWGKDWKFVLALLPFLVVLLPYVLFKARTINVLNLGETMAVGLGARVTREQATLLIAAVGLAGSCVSVSGSIGFVGLIGPHLARRLIGTKHQALIPASAMVGALLVIAADTIGRTVLQPSGIPTGIVVAVIGAPYFLYLMIRAKV